MLEACSHYAAASNGARPSEENVDNEADIGIAGQVPLPPEQVKSLLWQQSTAAVPEMIVVQRIQL